MEAINCGLARCAHVGGGDHPDLAAAGDHGFELVLEVADPGLDHERTQLADRVGACELCLELRGDVGLALGVYQQIALRERSGRIRRQFERLAERGGRLDALEDSGRQGNRLKGLGVERFDQAR